MSVCWSMADMVWHGWYVWSWGDLLIRVISEETYHPIPSYPTSFSCSPNLCLKHCINFGSISFFFFSRASCHLIKNPSLQFLSPPDAAPERQPGGRLQSINGHGEEEEKKNPNNSEPLNSTSLVPFTPRALLAFLRSCPVFSRDHILPSILRE